MNRLETLQKENKNLKELLEEVYEMSCLDDMISGGCLDRNDDEMLLCNLSLKSQIVEALGKRKLANEIKLPMPKIEEVANTLKHNSSKVLADHYSKEKN
mgnify:CR=1 FL=1